MMLEMSMESVFALVDVYFVSHLGKHATSTDVQTESAITIVYSLAIGISMAASAIGSQTRRRKKYGSCQHRAYVCHFYITAGDRCR